MVHWCIDSFRFAFTLGLAGTPTPWPNPPNSKKVQQNPDATWQLIKDEINKGFIIGPFKEKPIPKIYCVPINIVEKEMSLGLFRLVQDFSYPWDDPDNGINTLVPSKNKKVSYAGIDDGSIPWSFKQSNAYRHQKCVQIITT